MSPKKSPRHGALKAVLILVMVLLLAASGFMIKLCLDLAEAPVETQPKTQSGVQLPASPTEPSIPETTQPVPEHVVSTATIGSMGDLLMHMTIFDAQKYNAAVQQKDGSYDFESVFRYLTPYTSALDYTAINLETTLCGTDNGYAYSGYPLFNCPDAIVDGALDAGFDMMLTANNHSYDTGLVGYKRTLEVIRETGLETLGTYLSPEETRWSIVDVNGIRIGMLCYTYATGVTSDGRPSLNHNVAISEAGICNYFYADALDSFYGEVTEYLDQMEQAGAEATMIFLHWGNEYELTQRQTQTDMAQRLCDLGVDVIVGGHPHVVQPMDLLESTLDPDHKTVCLYSMGNAVSNQRLGNLDAITTAHTEDGVLFTVTFEKYSDGTVYLAGTDILPTWVNMHNNDSGRTEYNILPLDPDQEDQWSTMFDISEDTVASARNSLSRTMAIVGDGLEECQLWLAGQKQQREQYYYDLAYGNAS